MQDGCAGIQRGVRQDSHAILQGVGGEKFLGGVCTLLL